MIQAPQVPIPDSLDIDVPLPGAFERWRDLYLVTGFEKVLVFLAFGVVLYLLARLARRSIGGHIEDVNRRHMLRKAVGYSNAVLLVFFAVALFADRLAGLGAILAVLIAGIAVALQDVLKSVVGWIYLSGKSGVEIGSRIETDGIIGDVIDIGLLKTTMLEVGGDLVYGRQSTGRLVTVPNYRLLAGSVLIATAHSPFVWNEIRLTVTFESDWRRAEEIMREIGNEIHEEIAPQLKRGFRYLEKRYAFKYGALTPIVYTSIGDSGVHLTLRFLVQIRRRRGASDHTSRRLLAALASEDNIDLAYPTYRMYRVGNEPLGGRPPLVGDEGAHGIGPDDGMVVDEHTIPPPPE